MSVDRHKKIIILVVLLAVGVYAAFHKKKFQFPPPLNDLSTFEYEKLKAAAIAPSSKATAAIAVSSFDPAHNRIDVSSNAEDGTILQLKIEEVPGTVVEPRGKLQEFRLRPLFQHFMQTPPLHLSPGEYNLSLSSVSNPEKLTERRLFLGGIEDANYKELLTEAQGRRNQEATAEFKELLEYFGSFDKREQILKKIMLSKGNDGHQIGKLEAQWKALEKKAPPRDLSKAIYPKPFQKIRRLELDLNRIYLDVQRALKKSPAHIQSQLLQKWLAEFDSELSSWRTEIEQLKLTA